MQIGFYYCTKQFVCHIFFHKPSIRLPNFLLLIYWTMVKLSELSSVDYFRSAAAITAVLEVSYVKRRITLNRTSHLRGVMAWRPFVSSLRRQPPVILVPLCRHPPLNPVPFSQVVTPLVTVRWVHFISLFFISPRPLTSQLVWTWTETRNSSNCEFLFTQ